MIGIKKNKKVTDVQQDSQKSGAVEFDAFIREEQPVQIVQRSSSDGQQTESVDPQRVRRVRKRRVNEDEVQQQDTVTTSQGAFSFFKEDESKQMAKEVGRVREKSFFSIDEEEEPGELNASGFVFSENPMKDTINCESKPDSMPEEDVEVKSAEKSFTAEERVQEFQVIEPVEKDSLLGKLCRVIEHFNASDTNVYSEAISVKYSGDGIADVTVKNHSLILPLDKVYLGGRAKEWNRVDEVNIPMDSEVEIDLGISVIMPDNVVLEINGVPELTSKFGLALKEPIRLRRQEAIFPIVVKAVAVDDLAYVQKHQSLFRAQIIPV